MARLFVNPHTGQVLDFDSIPTYSAKLARPGRFCTTTHNPLDRVALGNSSCPAGPEHNEAWRAEQEMHVAEIERQLGEPNVITLGVRTAPPLATD